jgi:signal peptidase I
VFKAPPNENCGTKVDDLVKRVIGVPGDHLTSKGNTIYINGKALDETWSHYRAARHAHRPRHGQAQEQYFVMGDNSPGLLRQSLLGDRAAFGHHRQGLRADLAPFPHRIPLKSANPPPTMGPCSV